MIVGLGIDVVDVARFERAVSRTPGLARRLFADAELVVDGAERPVRSLAARWAAKEAAAKALGTIDGQRWRDLVVASDAAGAPSLVLGGAWTALAASRGVTSLHVSLTHDAGVAAAVVVAEA